MLLNWIVHIYSFIKSFVDVSHHTSKESIDVAKLVQVIHCRGLVDSVRLHSGDVYLSEDQRVSHANWVTTTMDDSRRDSREARERDVEDGDAWRDGVNLTERQTGERTPPDEGEWYGTQPGEDGVTADLAGVEALEGRPPYLLVAVRASGLSYHVPNISLKAII